MRSRNWFDDFAVALAGSRSRREFLTRVAAVVAGAAVTLRPKTAEASPDCTEACKRRGLQGKDLGQCIAGCNRGEFVLCGPNVCVDGDVCCNESCGICTPPGGFCIQIPCT